MSKIIPFPGVSFNMAINTQEKNRLADFMAELGYAENRETPDRFQNGLDVFLREMGYAGIPLPKTVPKKRHMERHTKSGF
jgi:hypothetical protein